MERCKLRFDKRRGFTYFFRCDLEHKHQSFTNLRMRGFLIADAPAWWGDRQPGYPFKMYPDALSYHHRDILFLIDAEAPHAGGRLLKGKY